MARRWLCRVVCMPVAVFLSVTLFNGFYPRGTAHADAPDAKPVVEIELLEAGQPPLREVRLKPTVGETSSIVMTMKMGQAISLNGVQQPAPALPAQKFMMDVNAEEVTSDGDIHYAFVYTDIDVVDDPQNPSPTAAAIKNLIQPMVGAKGSGIITNRGVAKKGEFDIPENLNPMLKSMLEGMKDSMNQLSSPVPSEAIGVGAKWRTVQNVVSNGMKLKQTLEHEVTAINDQGMTTQFTLKQEAEPQLVKNPMLPPTVTVMLDSLETKGSGTSQLDFGSIFPHNHVTKIASNINMTISAGGQNQTTSTDMNVEMTLEPAKP